MHRNQLDCVELKFPVPESRPLSINQANRMHWAAKRRELEPWRDGVMLAWKTARPLWHKVKDRKVRIELELPFPDKRRRDPHNYVVVLKALIDALTTQRETVGKHTVIVWDGCWPDDTPEWVETTEPILVIGDEVVFRIIPVLKYPLPSGDPEAEESGRWDI